MKRAIITGLCGQDGTYLSEYLLANHYVVTGVDSTKSSIIPAELLTDIDICKKEDVFYLINDFKPDEIYHLAAFHHSSEDKIYDELSIFTLSNNINIQSTCNLLEGIRKFSPKTRLFYAGSSHMFGFTNISVQNETTPFSPDCIYGITKYTGTKLCHYYRQKYNTFASVGLLYNHESPLRSPRFVSRKIVQSAVDIKKGRETKLTLGDLDTEIDWGYAKDYVVAMHKILQHHSPDDFIVSSGSKHKIKEFVEEVFRYVEIDWKKHIMIDPELIIKRVKPVLFGDNTKIKNDIGWQPETSFKKLVKIMVDAEMANDE